MRLRINAPGIHLFGMPGPLHGQACNVKPSPSLDTASPAQPPGTAALLLPLPPPPPLLLLKLRDHRCRGVKSHRALVLGVRRRFHRRRFCGRVGAARTENDISE